MFAAIEGCGGVPPIRPLETLHNALSLKQLDYFLEKMTAAPLFRTPTSTPPQLPSTPRPSVHPLGSKSFIFKNLTLFFFLGKNCKVLVNYRRGQRRTDAGFYRVRI